MSSTNIKTEASGINDTENLKEIPHKLQGLLEYPQTMLENLVIICIILALLALLCFIIFKVWKRGNKKTEQVKHPIFDIIESIEGLDIKKPFTNRVYQVEFYFSLSMMLRQAIESASDIAATDMTTGELSSRLKNKVLPLRGHYREIVDFVQKADYVKFAKISSTEDEACEYKKLVLRWAKLLKPHPSDIIITSHSDKNKPRENIK